MASAPQSICILRLSAIGDVCHAVAAVQALQRHFPGVPITWIIGKVEAMLLDGLPGVDLVVFDKKLGRKAYSDLAHKLGGREFDVLLHMQVAFRANVASLFIKAKRKIGFNWTLAKELHALFMRERIAPQHQPHVLDGFAGFVRHLGVPFLQQPGDVPVWQMPITDEHRAWAKAQLLKQLPKQVTDQHTPLRGHLVISPAASKAERNWLPERYAALADHAYQQGFAVYICGGPTQLERDLAAAIEQHASAPLHNLVGKTNLKQLLALLEQATLVVAPDTGPAHMAVTVGTPVIGLYGHSNPARTGPYLSRDYVVEVYHDELKRQTGKTAAELPWGTRVKGAHIMALISTERVIAMFDRVVTEIETGYRATARQQEPSA
ncbi:MAG TPA: ADP-heptose--LPS heptosyltransferase I [Rheinheimera sp.]|nr:ADP-heptose--LPS heptosyltransferase I [Rheinheimera sp.]